MRENHSPTVCLDGSNVRRIREEKKFTQLYVAKVVGVTTDTISRWENNRYPTIKRSNAIRLAEALEVELEEILKAAEEEAGQEGKGGHRFPPIPLLVMAVVVVVLTAFWLSKGGEEREYASVQASRLLPTYAAPSTTIPVRVQLQTKGEVKGFILREHFPKGWKLVEATPPPSSLDNVEGMARWIIKAGQAVPAVYYRLQVSPDVTSGGEGRFAGEVVATPRRSGDAAKVAGASWVRVAFFHWADGNGNSVIEDEEILDASETVDEMKQVHLDMDAIEAIWDAGGYRWDADTHRFSPVRGNSVSTGP